MRYFNISSSPDFAEVEKRVISFWKEYNVFQKSVEQRPANNHFVFYDGPPFANGLPHYGHLLTGYIKDVYARYQTMKGKRVERRFGWDCHGLPAEMGAEKDLHISGKAAIMKFGIDKFNEQCRVSVMKYTKEWEDYVTKSGRWVDFDNSYKTMDTNFMESVMWAFKTLHDKGLIYESTRIMPYSWACETPLSNFETRLDNSYRQRVDKAITVSFVIDNQCILENELFNKEAKYRILAWTTTPWTLPSNLALAVNPDMEYVIASHISTEARGVHEYFILAKFAFETYAADMGFDSTNITIIKGSDLVGLRYCALFQYFTHLKKENEHVFSILPGDFVLEGSGTGIVHMAPGFGEDDHVLCSAYSIPTVCPIDSHGRFTSEVVDFKGMQVFDTNDQVIIKLKGTGHWHKTEQYSHSYPHCWRTDTPLIYRSIASWYVKVTDFKDRMVELNKEINWIPDHIQQGLFGKWLENARDWSISRNRFWGTPIPVWKSDDPQYPRIDVYGSISDIERDFGVKVEDLHRPFIDSLVRPNPNDPTKKSMMRRVEDVFDCWFESGSMPYGQVHYPFENKTWFDSNFPADFIVEYVAQTRGWFYTLMVLSTALFDRPPFKNCICHGVILDAEGQKLSKRLNNYADPLKVFEDYGSDALRYTMLSSTVSKGEELLIDKDCNMVYDSLRLHIKPLWNAYNFFVMYANADDISAVESFESNNVLDQYILYKLVKAIEKIDDGLTKFDTQIGYIAMSEFFEVLNNWYIRRNRSRFWESGKSDDKINAYNTLYTCLRHMCRAIAPLLPIVSEEIYLGLHGKGEIDNIYIAKNSVHLSTFPDVSKVTFHTKNIDQVVQRMDIVRDICSTGLFIRNTNNVRVRQPLQDMVVVLNTKNRDKSYYELQEFVHLIQDELNVKEVQFSYDIQQYADIKLALNFSILGKRLASEGKNAKMKEMITDSKSGAWEETADGRLAISGEILNADEFAIVFEPRKIEEGENSRIAMKVFEHGIVALNLEINEDLMLEGYARDLIRIMQNARKDGRCNIVEHVRIILHTAADTTADRAMYEMLLQTAKKHHRLIADQTLSEFNIIAYNERTEYESSVFTSSVGEIGDIQVTVAILS